MQQFITTALALDDGEYLSSIGYGWEQPEGGKPQLSDMSATDRGVSALFVDVAKHWNEQSTPVLDEEEEASDEEWGSSKRPRKKARKGKKKPEKKKNVQLPIPDETCDVTTFGERHEEDEDGPGGGGLGGEIPVVEVTS